MEPKPYKTNKQPSFIDRSFFFLICIDKSENCGYITHIESGSFIWLRAALITAGGLILRFPMTAHPWFAAVHVSAFFFSCCFFLFFLNSFSSVSAGEREGEEDKRFPARKEDKTQTPGRENPQQRMHRN